MKKLLGIMAVGGLLLLLSGCEKPPQSMNSTTNPSVPVEKMFTHEGCTVYRFRDDGRLVYYTNCKGSTQSTVQSGKTTRPVNVQTTIDGY